MKLVLDHCHLDDLARYFIYGYSIDVISSIFIILKVTRDNTKQNILRAYPKNIEITLESNIL